MPESPLVQKETVALADLEALIAARAKGESETELGFRKRIDREEAEYHATAKHLAEKYKVDNTAMEADYSRAREQVVADVPARHPGDQGRVRADQEANRRAAKKDSRRAKKTKEETGWQALAMFEGQRDEGIKWRRGTDADWAEEIAFLHHEAGRSGVRAQTLRPAGKGDSRSRWLPRRSRRLPSRRSDSPHGRGRPTPADAAAHADEPRAAEPPAEVTPLITLQPLCASASTSI